MDSVSDSERAEKRGSRRRSSEERSRKKREPRRDRDDSPREGRGKRARTHSPSPDDRAVAKRYWGSNKDVDRRSADRQTRRPEPSNDRYPLGDRYYNTNKMDVKAEPPARKPADDMLNTRTGGAYIPPARLRMMQAQITDKSSAAYQRIAWEALKKSIHGHINKINVGNIGIIIKQLLKENIVRGRGLLCRSIIQAQAASPTFTNVYAALVAAVNSRFPNVGELLLKRLVIQFKRGFKRNDKAICISAATFIAHLVNQRVAHEILALELLTLLVETPTDDSVEVAIAFLKECGQKLTEVSSKGVNAIFEMLRNILHEGALDKRVQYMIEVIFQVWKDGFKDHAAVLDELELVPEEEQFTHLMMLDEATDAQDLLNVFKLDEKYEENEQKYKDLSKEILGSDAESGSEGGSGSEDGSDGSDDEEEPEEGKAKDGVTIIDNTETNLIALRRTIYLTINSSLDFEECAHKLMKMQLKPGQEIELCHMFLDCCAEQRTYEKFYGLLAQRFCQINKIYISPFEEIFRDSYATAHRLDTNRLRNVSKFFAHLLFTDSISWEALECVKLNEEDTTSSSRIYIKILFQELAEYMGLKKLNDRLRDVTLQDAFQGLFPRDNPKNTRFSINFFTSIGLGGLTDDLREHLKQIPKNAPQLLTEINVADSSSSSSSSSSSDPSSSESSSSSSDSDSDEENEKSKQKKKSSKKNKNKSASPEKDQARDKENERWGHDGFYDTYGKDAVRNPRGNDREDRGQRNGRANRSQQDGREDRRQQNGNEYRRQRNDREDRSQRNDREDRSQNNDREDRSQRNERDGRGQRNDREDRSERNERDTTDPGEGRSRKDRENRENRENPRRNHDESETPRNKEDDWDIRRASSLRREGEPRQSYWNARAEPDRREDRDLGTRRETDSTKERRKDDLVVRKEGSGRREERNNREKGDGDKDRKKERREENWGIRGSSIRKELVSEEKNSKDGDLDVRREDRVRRERRSSTERSEKRNKDRRPPVPSEWEKEDRKKR